MRSFLSFALFLSTFLFIYGLLHLYFYRKVTKAVPAGPRARAALAAALLVMVLAPIGVNVFVHNGYHGLATAYAYAGYTWMGGLFLFFCIHLLVDFLRICAVRLPRTLPSVLRTVLTCDRRWCLVLVLVAVSGIVCYGFFEASRPVVTRLEFITHRLPPEVSRFRIVQISDVHFSALNGERLAEKIVREVETLSPDILVSTGDFVDRGLAGTERVARLFRSLHIPHGCYGVTGNHEFYAGVDDSSKFLEAAGFTMLRNRTVQVDGILHLAGVDDPAGRRFGLTPPVSEHALLDGPADGDLVVLLKHQPRIDEHGKDRFDLQLSGHTHGGQIYPFGLLTSLTYSFAPGFHRVGHRSHLVVSRGTGTWGPPIRVLSPPEIVVIDFHRDK